MLRESKRGAKGNRSIQLYIAQLVKPIRSAYDSFGFGSTKNVLLESLAEFVCNSHLGNIKELELTAIRRQA